MHAYQERRVGDVTKRTQSAQDGHTRAFAKAPKIVCGQPFGGAYGRLMELIERKDH